MRPYMADYCLASEGWFWSACGGARVRGEFTAETGRNAEVRLAGRVADDPRVTVVHTATGSVVTSVSGDPAKDVAAFAPQSAAGMGWREPTTFAFGRSLRRLPPQPDTPGQLNRPRCVICP
jgi:hypothetical protein